MMENAENAFGLLGVGHGGVVCLVRNLVEEDVHREGSCAV